MTLLYVTLALCIITAVSIIGGFIFFLLKKPKIELLFGYVSAVSAFISYAGYYYARMVLSGGTFSDWRVVNISVIYVVSLIIAMFFVFHGQKKSRENQRNSKGKAL